MNTYKTLISKLSLTAVALFIAAGCATVTDANMDLPQDENTVLSVERTGDTWDSSNDDDMDPIIDKPEMTD